MKTAIQNVLDLVQKRLDEFDGLTGFEVTMMKQELNWFKEILKKNLKKEKYQIIGAVEYGCSDWGSSKDSKKYYNEKYNNEKD
jgi:hypothetical protein